MGKEVNIIPLKVEAKKYANSKILSVDIPEDIIKKFPKVVSKGKAASVLFKEEKGFVCIIYQFDK
jgi:hypothetical protein